MGMDFGLFYEIMIPKPWGPRTEYEAFQQVIAQVIQAEASGFSHFWTVEHHFLTEMSHCSAPEVLYGAISQRTKKIRIGHGVRLLPFPYNHPVRAAEMAATLDLLCDGRLEFGTGRSASLREIEGFGIDITQTRPMWEEALEVVVGAWTNETFSWDGKYFKVPPRTVVPKPLQKPHPPIWCAASGPESHEIAGRKGLGVLSLTLLIELEEVARRIAMYKAAVKEAKPVGKFINNQAAAYTLVYCAETDEQARREAAKSMEWYIDYSSQIASEFARKIAPGGDAGGYDYYKQTGNLSTKKLTFDYLSGEDLVICGSPDTCVRKIKRYQAMGIEQLLCICQLYSIPHQQVMNSIKLFGEQVIPHFR